jgi:hypothetical protein
MIITVASSDKLTLSMFSDYYKCIYDRDIKIVDITCLYSKEILTLKLEALSGIKIRNVLIKYKMKPQTKDIPSILTEKSSVLLLFDIYSMEPVIVKSIGSDTEAMITRWKLNIERFNQQKV